MIQSLQRGTDLNFTPLRIFLSYGHDTNEELVSRIKADLEQRGHDAWFDKSDMKFGDDWRRAITDGITGSVKGSEMRSRRSSVFVNQPAESIASHDPGAGHAWLDARGRWLRRSEAQPPMRTMLIVMSNEVGGRSFEMLAI